MAKLVYALVGPDSYLQASELSKILKEMPPDVQRADFEGESAELADVLDELRSFAMFGGAKIVIVRDADAFVSKYRASLEDYLAVPSESATLVLRLSSLPATQRVHKLIQKNGQIIPCEAPKDLARWAIEQAKSAHRVTLAPDAARMLADLIGDDLGRLDTEIAKLAISADGKISADLVTHSVAFTREREMWDLTNALATAQPTEAMRRWRQMIQADPSAEFRAVTWLGIWLGDASIIVHQGPRSAAAGKLKWKYKGDAFDKFTASAMKLGKHGLRRAINLLAEIDKQSKTGVGDAAENVERFILAISPPAARST